MGGIVLKRIIWISVPTVNSAMDVHLLDVVIAGFDRSSDLSHLLHQMAHVFVEKRKRALTKSRRDRFQSIAVTRPTWVCILEQHNSYLRVRQALSAQNVGAVRIQAKVIVGCAKEILVIIHPVFRYS